MKKLLLLLILTSLSYATTLLTYNIYDREDRVDIMLSFNSPYNGKIFQNKSQDGTALKLENLDFDKSIDKTIDSKIVQQLEIKPEQKNLLITLKNRQNVEVVASKTIDKFGLRIRVKLAKTAPKDETSAPSSINSDDNLKNIAPFKDSNLVDARYITVVTFLFVLLVIMLWFKKRVTKNPLTIKQKSWLFKNITKSSDDIKIIYKKPIDSKNSLLLFEYESKKYLIMTGSSNILIDTFGKDDLRNSSDFEQAFEDNRKKLDEYLRLQDNKLEDYKDKASNEHLHEQK